jgi:Pyruvate/2-oxoacid:ferredoxin oxidoreductase gamma subunit
VTPDEHDALIAAKLDSIAIQLGRVANLIALGALTEISDRPQAEQIALLLKAGFTPAETAAIVDTTPGTVRSARARLRNSEASAKKTSKTSAQ